VSEPEGGSLQRSANALVARGEEPAAREFLAFELGNEHYALPLHCVREIVRVPQVTEVPRGPEEVLGVISVRGAVTTLIDLRRKLRLPQGPIDAKSRVLLVESGPEVVGMLVDAVLEVKRLTQEEIELASVLGAQAPPHLLGIGRPGLAGGARDILLLLDPSAVLRS
jgi:purine-binding chemotaxis protein CheW